MSNTYLSSFYPLCSTRNGRIAIEKYSLKDYIDGSCRREPDFEHEMPCITGLCRPNFVGKLQNEDKVIYVTNKKGVGSRKLIAVLRVVEILDDHCKAADYYILKNLPLPSNIMVASNPPIPLDKTHQKGSWDKKGWPLDNISLENWDKGYLLRSMISPKVAVCEIEYLNRCNPFDIEIKSDRELVAQNPPILRKTEIESIKNSIRQKDPKYLHYDL